MLMLLGRGLASLSREKGENRGGREGSVSSFSHCKESPLSFSGTLGKSEGEFPPLKKVVPIRKNDVMTGKGGPSRRKGPLHCKEDVRLWKGSSIRKILVGRSRRRSLS